MNLKQALIDLKPKEVLDSNISRDKINNESTNSEGSNDSD